MVDKWAQRLRAHVTVGDPAVTNKRGRDGARVESYETRSSSLQNAHSGWQVGSAGPRVEREKNGGGYLQNDGGWYCTSFSSI